MKKLAVFVGIIAIVIGFVVGMNFFTISINDIDGGKFHKDDAMLVVEDPTKEEFYHYQEYKHVIGDRYVKSDYRGFAGCKVPVHEIVDKYYAES